MENEDKVIHKSQFPYRLGFGILFGLLGWFPIWGLIQLYYRQKFNRLRLRKRFKLLRYWQRLQW